MNQQKAQTAINKIVEENKRRNARAYGNQYPPSKAQIAKLTELGLIDMMPVVNHKAGIGYTNAALVIEASEIQIVGAGEDVETFRSDLYKALNEEETPEPTDDEDETILLSEEAPSQTSAGASGTASRDGDELHLTNEDDGWYYCFSGIADGNYYETDDFGPFDSKQDAYDAAMDHINTEAEAEDAAKLNDVMTAAEVADTYGIANATVRQTIARGAIRARKSGSTWLILRSDAERFWNRSATKGVTTWLVTVLAVLAIVSQL